MLKKLRAFLFSALGYSGVVMKDVAKKIIETTRVAWGLKKVK
jgi:hypothetical protein